MGKKFTDKEWILKASNYAKKKGGRFLKIYKRKKKLGKKVGKWKCSEGHIWDATLVNILRKKNPTWCKKCYQKSQKVADATIMENANIYASKKNGICLKILRRKKHKGRIYVLCKCNTCNDEPFEIRYNHLTKGHWHIQCLGKEKINFKNVSKTAKEKGGKFLKFVKPTIYKSKKDIRGIFECLEGHRWEASISLVRAGRWCKICSESISERICKVVFEALFESKFPKSYPDFLLNKKTNRNLELDGFNSDLKIAFEYQGFFHSKKSIKLTKNKDLNKKVIVYDYKKKNLCKKNGIKLIQIPDFKNDKEKIPNFIISKLNDMKIKFNKKNIEKIDINKAYFQRPITEFQKTLNKNNFKLKHNLWKGAYPAYEIICPNKHEFKRTISKINNLDPSKWCTECNDTKKFANRYNTKGIIQILKKYNLKITSKHFLYEGNDRIKINLKCQKNHSFQMNFKSIKGLIRANKIICSICKGRKITIDIMNEVANKLGGECLSKNYDNATQYLKFRCKRNHTFLRNRNQMTNNGRWCINCKKIDGNYPKIVF